MAIDKTNYEAYFLDYHEGNISPLDEKELFEFLAANPDLKADLDAFELISLENDAPKSNELLKATLRKEELTDLSELDYLLISSLEGQLNSIEQVKLEKLKLASEEVSKREVLYSKTKIKREALLFSNKEKLKRKPQIIYLMRYAAVAAAVIAAILIWPSVDQKQEYLPRTADVKIQEQYEDQKLQMAQVTVIDPAAESKEEKRSSPVIKTTKKKRKVLTEEFQEIQPELAQELSEPELPATENLTQQSEPLHEALSEKPEETIQESIQTENTSTELIEANEVAMASEEEFIPLDEFAKEKIKKELFKNKTFTETLADELASISNDKIGFKRTKNEAGETEQFAFNIGKFSYSRNK